jgi:hypothetical protein
MNWKNIKISQGSKLFKQHSFMYMHKGVNYILEVDEFHNGTFTGHGESSVDKNFVLESVTGNSIEDCIQNLITKISERS